MAGLRKLPADAFAPFDRSTWFGADLESYDWCVRWPRATHAPDPARPPGAAYPSIPTLVLDGDLDQRTSLIGARRVASQFPHSTLVPVPNQGHVTALVDWYGCAAGIVRRFIATRRASGTACARENPALHLVAAFPRTSRTAPEATPASGDASFAAHRRAAWCAAQAVADAVARYPPLPGTAGVGLRGGHFSVRHGAYLDHGPVTLRLRGVRFCADVAVSGAVTWFRTSGRVRAQIAYGTAHASLTWSLATLAPARLQGEVTRAGESPVALRLTVPAPCGGTTLPAGAWYRRERAPRAPGHAVTIRRVTVHEQVELIETREDLVVFIEQLRTDHEDHPEGWGNSDLASFLDGLAGWTDDMAGYLTNRGVDSDEIPVWRLFGMMLLAAAAYE